MLKNPISFLENIYSYVNSFFQCITWEPLFTVTPQDGRGENLSHVFEKFIMIFALLLTKIDRYILFLPHSTMLSSTLMRGSYGQERHAEQTE